MPTARVAASVDQFATLLRWVTSQCGLMVTVQPRQASRPPAVKASNEMVSRVSVARFARGGDIPTSANAILSETHRTWNRREAAELAKLYGLVAPNYAAVMRATAGPRSGREEVRVKLAVAFSYSARMARLPSQST